MRRVEKMSPLPFTQIDPLGLAGLPPRADEQQPDIVETQVSPCCCPPLLHPESARAAAEAARKSPPLLILP